MRAPESEARERGWLIGGSSRKVGTDLAALWPHLEGLRRLARPDRLPRNFWGRQLSGRRQGGVVSSDTTTRVRAILGSTPEEFRRLQEGNWIGFGAPWVSGKEAYFSQFTKDEHILR